MTNNNLDTLRMYVRGVLRNLKKQQRTNWRNELNEERSLRKNIRKMLREKQDIAQHNSTGINALEKLLNSIVPILEAGYKDLKTDENQRKSFKAHILRGVQNLLSTASIYFSADRKQSAGGVGTPQLPAVPPAAPAAAPAAGGSLKEDGKAPVVEQDPQFIDIDKDKKQAEKPNPINAFQAVEGEDLTGRNFALETFKKIQKQILETYSLLSNEQDRETFYDYLLTNVKLYFDKFETELQATPAEPTTPEYEAEKAKIDASLQGAAPPTGGTVPPPPAPGAPGELPPEPPEV